MISSTSILDVGARTDIGRRRKDNQDCVLLFEDWSGAEYGAECNTYGYLYLVADGVGGNDDGDVASKMVVDNVMTYFYGDDSSREPVVRLGNAIQRATRDIYEEALRRRNNMASTLVAALVYDGKLLLANVGDSPAFLLRAGESPFKLTVDHVRKDNDGNQYLAQSMGDATVTISFRTVEFVANDVVVLCTDGLSDLVNPDQIKRVVRGSSARRASRELVKLANSYGGHDNVSVLVVRQGKLPLLARKQVRQIGAAGLGIALLAILLLWALPTLLTDSDVARVRSEQDASFNGISMSVPLFNPTTGLVEMVPATHTPTPQPSEVPPVAATAVIAVPRVVKTGTPVQVVRTVVAPTTRVSMPSITATSGKAATVQATQVLPTATTASSVPTAASRPTDVRPTHTVQPTEVPVPREEPRPTIPPTAIQAPTNAPPTAAPPTDTRDESDMRPTQVPTAAPRPTEVPPPTALPEPEPEPKPDPKPEAHPNPKPEPKPDPKSEPTLPLPELGLPLKP